jgi:short-subunit dehydrogenase
LTPFVEDATYVIFGGLGGFGVAIAQWMIQRNAKNIVLVSRSGIPTADRVVLLEAMKKQANIQIMKCDLSCIQDMRKLVSTIRESMPEIKGMIHSAMDLVDCLIEQQTLQTFFQSMSPKVWGAWNMHLVSLDMKLDHFIVFSSTGM